MSQKDNCILKDNFWSTTHLLVITRLNSSMEIFPSLFLSYPRNAACRKSSSLFNAKVSQFIELNLLERLESNTYFERSFSFFAVMIKVNNGPFLKSKLHKSICGVYIFDGEKYWSKCQYKIETFEPRNLWVDCPVKIRSSTIRILQYTLCLDLLMRVTPINYLCNKLFHISCLYCICKWLHL